MICEITVCQQRGDGSAFGGSKWFGTWHWQSSANGWNLANFTQITSSDGGLDVSGGDDGGSPASAQISVGALGPAGNPRYIVEVEQKLFLQ